MKRWIKATVEALFEVVPHRSTPQELAFVCPEKGCPDKSGNRSVNLITGKTNCWRCNKGGDFAKWARNLGYEVDDSDAGIPEDELESALQGIGEAPRVSAAYFSDIKLPRGFTKLSKEPECAYARQIGRMAERKNLTLRDFIRAGVGFTRKDRRWEPYAIFPVTEWGRVVYFQGRLYNDAKAGQTKRNPSREDTQYGSKYWIYNVDALREPTAKCCVIVESILNVMSLKKEFRHRGIQGVVPVAIFKHAISREQAKKLQAIRHIKEFCLMFDADAVKDSIRASRRYDLGNCTFVPMPFDKKGKGIDANDDAELAVDLWLKRKPTAGKAGLLAEVETMISKL